MKAQSNIFLSGIVKLETTADGLVSVTVEEPVSSACTTLVLGSETGRDEEFALYAQHALLEYRLAQVAKLIDERHAKRVTTQTKPEVLQ